MKYQEFIIKKSQFANGNGFNPLWIPDFLFDFQKYIVEYSIKKGRSLIAADCGLGKTIMELVIAQNIVQHTNKNVLILTPLAVNYQMILEAEKFGVEVSRSQDGNPKSKITISNYEQLHKFDRNDYIQVICDESSILKNFNGVRKGEITEFTKKMPYRLLATATASPNDYIELGTSSEALGYLGFIDMLNQFFKNDNNNVGLRRMYGEAPKWRFKKCAEIPFWRWVTSWALACRKPSDLGFDDNGFILPNLIEKDHLIEDIKPANGFLFNMPASKLDEQRDETRRTINERCEKVAELVNDTGQPAFIGCHLNQEGKLLKQLIPDSIEISGSDSDEKKEEKFLAFLKNQVRILITKPKIGAWGLNLQHCNHVIYFPSHSYELYYQFVRRCWRFGQKRQVTIDRIFTEGLQKVVDNVNRKANQADRMFDNLVNEMNNSLSIKTERDFNQIEQIPQWLLN